MSLHAEPKSAAEAFALHLETTYGIQLDFARHSALVGEIEAFSRSAAPVESEPRKKRAKKENHAARS